MSLVSKAEGHILLFTGFQGKDDVMSDEKEDRASIVQRKVGLYVPTLTSFCVGLVCTKQCALILGLQLGYDWIANGNLNYQQEHITNATLFTLSSFKPFKCSQADILCKSQHPK